MHFLSASHGLHSCDDLHVCIPWVIFFFSVHRQLSTLHEGLIHFILISVCSRLRAVVTARHPKRVIRRILSDFILRFDSTHLTPPPRNHSSILALLSSTVVKHCCQVLAIDGSIATPSSAGYTLLSSSFAPPLLHHERILRRP